jgi:cobalt-zinc-cadmium efflux system outer membrane protein
VPLFDRRQPDRLAAEARLLAARAELDLARARAEAERAGALAAFARLHGEAAEAERAAAETEGLLTGAAAAYRLGESGLTDFLDALRAALAVRETALELQEAALAAHRNLEAAAGRPLTSPAGGLP